jgi:NitT/TauT family transport system substrate-binding protein
LAPGGPSLDGVALVASGASQVGQLSSSPSLMMARSQGIPVKAFAIATQEHPWAFFSMPDKPVREPKDLVGKRIGSSPTSDILVRAALKANDISIDDVEIVVIGAEVTPLTQGKIDVWTGWLINTAALAPLKHEYLTLRLWDCGVQLYANNYYTTDSVLQKSPDLLQEWLTVTAKGWAYANDNLDEAVDIFAKQVPGTDVADFKESLEILLKASFNDQTQQNGFGTMDPAKWQSMIDQWDALEQFKGVVPKVEDVMTMDILNATTKDRPTIAPRT